MGPVKNIAQESVIDTAHQGIVTTGIPLTGLIVDVTVGGLILVIYCYRVGGLRAAFSRFKGSNWRWLGTDVGLPLGIPIAVGLVVVAFAWSAEMTPVPEPWVLIEEMTPWTLTFFSLTLLSSTLSRLAGKEGREGWTTLVWIAILFDAFFAGMLTIARHSPGWHAGIRPYSAAGLLTFLAIWISHANSRA